MLCPIIVFPIHLALTHLIPRVDIYCSLQWFILPFLTSSIPSHLLVSLRMVNLLSALPRAGKYDKW
jgi:hypothetical protein